MHFLVSHILAMKKQIWIMINDDQLEDLFM
jgi:hypothetical protein